MKKYFLLSIVLLSFLLAPLSQAIAEVPKTLNYQGRLLDAKLEGLDQTLPITFELYDSEFGGQKLWGETQNVSIERGYFNVELGEDTPINLPFNKQYWLQVTVANESPYPRTALTQVPYAFRTITADTAEWALQLIDGALTISMMSDEARTVAGGDVIGTYPELYLRDGAVVENIGQGEITQMMLSPNVTTPPSGPARGDLTGNYPDPLIAEGAVKTNRIADGAVTYAKLQPADGPIGTILGWDGTNWIETDVPTWEIDATIGNEVLDATVDGGLERVGTGTDLDPYTLGIMDGGVTNVMLAGGITGDKLVDGTLGLNLMAPGQSSGQVAWWNGTDWVLTPAGLPNNTQVLKWVLDPAAQTWGMEWADDEFTVPYAYVGSSKNDMNMGVTMLSLILDEADNTDQNVFYAEIDDEDAGSAIVARNSGRLFDQGHLPVIDAEGTSDLGFPDGVMHGVANVATIHNGASTAGYFEHSASGTSTVGSISSGVFALNEVGSAINNTDHIGVFANVVAGGGDAWGTASIADGNAQNNIGAVGFAEGANTNNWGVLGLSDSNPITFFEGDDAAYTLPNEAAVVALSNQAGNNNVALYVENVAANSRAAYIRGGGVNNGPFFADPTDMDNATLVVYNPAAGTAPFATAIKTYGDIWANSAVGASQLVGLDKLTLTTGAGTYNTADAATYGELVYEALGAANTTGFAGINASADGSAIRVEDDLYVNNQFAVAGDAYMNEDLRVNGIMEINGPTTFNNDVTINADLTVTGTSTLGNTVTITAGGLNVTGPTDLNSGLNVDGNTTLDNTDITGTFNVTGVTTLDQTTVDGLFTVNGNSDLNGTLAIANTTTIEAGGLNVTGATDLNTGLNVDGATTLDATTIAGTLTQSGGQVQFGGNVDALAGLDVTGALTVSGTSTLGNTVTITAGGLNVTGATDLNSGLNVDGATTLDATTVDGLLDVNGQLDVLNNGLFRADVTINGDLTVLGSTDLTDASIEELTIEEFIDLGTFNADFIAKGASWNYVGGTWTAGANSAGTSGQFLVSRGAGLSPVWTNSAANLGLGDLYVENEIIIDAMPAAGATDVVLNSNALTFADANVTIGNASGTRGNLTVGNDALVNNDLAVINDAVVGNNLEVMAGDFTVYTGVADIQNSIVNGATGTVVVDDNFNVTGTSNFDMFADFDANVNIDGNLVVDGLSDLDDTDVNGTFDVVGNSTFTGTLTQGGGQVTFNGNVDATNGVDVTGGNLNVTNNANVTGNLDVDGVTTLDVTTVDDLFTVNAASDLNGTLNVQGLATMEANAVVNGNLDVDGDSQFGTVAGDYVQLNTGVEFRTGGVAPTAGVNDNILASRGAGVSPEWTSTLSNLSVDVLTVPTELNVGTAGVTDLLDVINVVGNVVVDGDLEVNAETQTNTLTVLDAAIIGDGDADDLLVAGDATINRDLTVANNANVQNDLDVDGNSNFDGNVQIDLNLNVDGVTTLDETDVDGQFRVINDNPAIFDGTVTIDDLTTITANLNVSNDVNVGDNLNVLDDLDVNGISTFGNNVTIENPGNLTVNTGNITLASNLSILDVRGSVTNTLAGTPLYLSDADGIRLADDADAVNGIHISTENPLAADDTDLVTEGAVFAALGNLINGDSGIDAVWNGGTNQWDLDWNGPLTKDALIDGAAAWDITFQNLANGFTVNAPADFQQTLNVDGAATLNSTLDVDLGTTLNSTLDVDGAATLNSTLDVDLATTLNNTLDVDGATTLNADVTLGDANTDNIVFTGEVNSNIIPNTTAVFDLGSNAQRWGDLYLDGATLHLGDAIGTEAMFSYAGGTTTLGVDATANVMTATSAVVDFNVNVDANAGLDVTGAFNVTGATTLTGTLNATGDVDFDANLNVDGNLVVDGLSDLDDTDVNGTFDVVGASTFTGSIDQIGGADLVNFAGNVNAANGLDVTSGNLNVTDNANVTGNLDVDGVTTLDVTTIDDLLTVNAAITQTGAANQVAFAGNVNAANGLDVTGANFTAGTTTIDPANGNTNVGGTLNVVGTSTFNDDVTLLGAGTDLAVGGNLAVTGTTLLTGNTAVTGDFDVDGNTTLDNAVIDGTLNTTGNVDFDANLNVDGSLVVDLTSTLTGNVDAQAGLDVTGADLTVGGANFTVTPATGNTVVGGTLDAQGQIFNSTGDVVINDADGLTITAPTAITGTITQSVGLVTFGGNVNANAGVDVVGDLTVDGSILQAANEKTVLGYSTAATLAALTASTGTVINYSAVTAVTLADLPAGVNGQVIYVVNTSGGIVNFDGTPVANNQMIGFVYAGGTWHRMP